MIKETKETIIITNKKRYCDECGIQVTRDLSCSIAICEYCGKDLCNKCVAYESPNTGYYRTVVCKDCQEISEPYLSKIDFLELEIDELREEFEKKCKENRNGKL